MWSIFVRRAAGGVGGVQRVRVASGVVVMSRRAVGRQSICKESSRRLFMSR